MTLTDYVYSRQKGVITQEIGQVGVTLMALAEHLGISAENAEFNEVLRITSKDPEHFKRGRMQNRPMVLV